MISKHWLWAASSICVLVNASALVVHERRHGYSDLVPGSRLAGSSRTKFRVGLKQSNLDRLYDHLANVSSPGSPHYGQHWSADQVRETFAPSEESIDTVSEWLTSSGLDVTERNGWISFETDIQHMESLLKTTYHEYQDVANDGLRIGCERYHLPEHIAKHVDFVTPAVSLSAPLKPRQVKRQWPQGPGPNHPHPWPTYPSPVPWGPWPLPPEPPYVPPPGNNSHLPPALRHCAHRVTPACIRALYGIPSPGEVASDYQSSAANSLGVFEGFGSYNQSDLNKFFEKYADYIPSGTHPIGESIDGARIKQIHNRPFTNTETALDIMVMYGLIYPQTITLYEVAEEIGKTDGESLAGFSLQVEALLDAIDGSFCSEADKKLGLDCGTRQPTNVISMSYGSGEIFSAEAYLHRQCAEFGKLGLQGTTFTISSGDWGVAAQPGVRVRGNSTELTNGCIIAGNYNESVGLHNGFFGSSHNGTVFSMQYPASCPFVTTVGATRLYPDDTVYDAESAMIDPIYSRGGAVFCSSGGFSNYFSRPSYQDDAVQTYFAQHDPGYPYYNFNGIDFSESGSNIGANGGIYNRLGRGFPDVSANGLNFPIIYDGKVFPEGGTSQAAPIWASIVTLINEKRSEAGKSPVGFINPVLYAHPEVFHDIVNGTNPGCFTDGFAAVQGWDPITGLGTPNYPKLLDLFLSLP